MSGYDPGYLGIFRELMAPDPSDVGRFERQNRQTSAHQFPEGRLWGDVLKSAVVDLLKPLRAPHHYESLEWIRNVNSDHVGSFQFVCSTLGIDPQAARKRLLNALVARGGSSAVIPKRRPKGAPPLPNRGRISKKVVLCRELASWTPSFDSASRAGNPSSQTSTAPAVECGESNTAEPIAVYR